MSTFPYLPSFTQKIAAICSCIALAMHFLTASIAMADEVPNGDFDAGLGGWTAIVKGNGGSINYDPSRGSPSVGSAVLGSDSLSNIVALTQCFPVAAQRVDFTVRIDSSLATPADILATTRVFDASSCGGDSTALLVGVDGGPINATNDPWHQYTARNVNIPGGFANVTLQVVGHPQTSVSFDHIAIVPTDTIFADRFPGSTPDPRCPYDAQSPDELVASFQDALADMPICVAPFSANIDGFVMSACQAPSMCSSMMPGCATSVRAQLATFAGSLQSGAYQIDIPATVDPLTTSITLAGLVTCNLTASNMGFHGNATFAVESIPSGGAYIDALQSALVNELSLSLTPSGCGPYASLVALAQPFVASEVEAVVQQQLSAIIANSKSSPINRSICPAP